MKKYFIVTCLLLSYNYLFAQLSKEEYKKRAQEARAEVQSWKIKAFENNTVPDSMSNHSYVILARHVELSGSAKSKVSWVGLGVGISKELVFSRTFRERVKIQDKAALDEYSYLNYKAYEGQKFSMALKRDVLTFVGARIIKPDGTVKDVDTDEAVYTTDEKNNREAKLAIAGLQVGDILDYYVQIYDKNKTMGWAEAVPMSFVLAEDVPILHYSLHGLISRKYALEHTSINGAPRIQVTEDGEDWELKAEVSSLPARPSDLWISRYRQLPIIRLNVLPLGKTAGASYAPRHKAGNLNEGVEKKELVQDVAVEAGIMHIELKAGSFVSMGKKIRALLKSYEKVHGKIPKDSLGLHVYYAMRYLAFYDTEANGKVMPVDASRNYFGVNENRFMLTVYEALKGFEVDCELIMATSKYGPSDKQAFLKDDYMYIVKLNEPSPVFLSMESAFTAAGSVPYHYEGQRATSIILKDAWATLGQQKVKPVFEEGTVEIPFENASANQHKEAMKVQFSENLDFISIDRTTSLTGHYREDAQKALLLFEDYQDEERKRFCLEHSLVEELLDNKKTRTLGEEYKAAMQKARAGLKEVFKTEIREQFRDEPKSVDSWKIIQSGIYHAAPDMIYTTRFSMDKMVKKAGDNYLFDIGKLAGSQLDVTDKQRKRMENVYMPYARSLTNVIEIEIPKGYQAEGLENLNMKTDNSAGLFESSATITDNKLVLKVSKTYKKSFLKLQEWPQLLEMLDKAVSFSEQKLLLKKL